MNEMANWFETQATTEHKNVLAEAVPEVIDFDSMDDRYWPVWLLRRNGAIVGVWNEVTEALYVS